MKRKNILRIIILSVLGSLVLVVGVPQESSAQKLLWKIGTAGSGGTFYFLGSGISNVITKYVPEIKLTSEATGCGIENMRRMNRGQLEMAFISPWDMPLVLKDGTAETDKISFFSGAHNSTLYLVVKKSTGFKTAKEAMHKGIKIGTGTPGSGVRTSVQFTMRAFGLTLQDVKSHPLSQSESAAALKDGTIDVFFGGSGVPLAAVSDICQSVDAVVLPFTDDDIKRIQKEIPYIRSTTVPAKTYRGQDKDVQIPAYASCIVVKSDLNADLVAKVMEAIYAHTNEIAQVHPAGKEISIERVYLGADYANSLGFKFHPGVIKYLKEIKKWDKKYEYYN